MPCEALSRALWQQRQHAELVIFKVEEAQLLCRNKQTRWLPYATQEIEAVLDEARTDELARDMAANATVKDLELEENASLQEIIEASKEPWKTVLTQHRIALQSIVEEISSKAKSLEKSLNRVRTRTHEDPIDQAILEITYRTASESVNYLVQPGLKEFLR